MSSEDTLDISSKIDEGKEIRREIQEVHRKKYNALKVLFSEVSGEEDKNLIKFITDMVHYRNGGYPKPNSKPKHHDVLNHFINLYKWMSFIGREKQYVTDYLKEHGITVTLDKPIENTSIESHKILIENSEPDTFFTTDAADLRQFTEDMLEVTDDLQGTICKLADSIKIDLASSVTAKGVKKGHFIDAVNFSYNADKDRKEINNEKRKTKTTRRKKRVLDEKLSHDIFANLKLIKVDNVEQGVA